MGVCAFSLHVGVCVHLAFTWGCVYAHVLCVYILVCMLHGSEGQVD